MSSTTSAENKKPRDQATTEKDSLHEDVFQQAARLPFADMEFSWKFTWREPLLAILIPIGLYVT